MDLRLWAWCCGLGIRCFGVYGPTVYGLVIDVLVSFLRIGGLESFGGRLAVGWIGK